MSILTFRRSALLEAVEQADRQPDEILDHTPSQGFKGNGSKSRHLILLAPVWPGACVSHPTRVLS